MDDLLYYLNFRNDRETKIRRFNSSSKFIQGISSKIQESTEIGNEIQLTRAS